MLGNKGSYLPASSGEAIPNAPREPIWDMLRVDALPQARTKACRGLLSTCRKTTTSFAPYIHAA